MAFGRTPEPAKDKPKARFIDLRKVNLAEFERVKRHKKLLEAQIQDAVNREHELKKAGLTEEAAVEHRRANELWHELRRVADQQRGGAW